jgi:thioredoxin-like negative regulator of GroEL
VDSPEPIPLGEAVARGIIPCSVCGASGAGVRKVGDKNHFLCPKCAGRGRAWTWILAALVISIVGLGAYLLNRGKKPDDPVPPEAKGAPSENVTKEIIGLMDLRQYAQARTRIQELLGPFPKRPDLNLLMGKCLMGLKAYDAALPHLKIAYDAGAPTADPAALFLGLSLKTIGHSLEALKYAEPPTELNKGWRGDLAEVYLDLERYDDCLKLLPEPSDPGALWARHRALVYQGKGDDARKLLEGRDEMEIATLRAGQLREEGDFAGAAKTLEALIGKVQPGSPAWHRAKRSELSLAIESGDLARLDAVIAELAADQDPQIQGEAVFARALGHLSSGKRDAAKASAWEFLAKTDKEFSPIRLERMMMRHLVGELKDADLEAEVKLLSRFHANDLLWYLALATGDRARAEQALASTPGHNYPYHSILRLLKK